jgi:two-component system, cell cycle sensor histidine kinase and response regulator CckA
MEGAIVLAGLVLAMLVLYLTQFRRNQNALGELAAERERLRSTEERNRQIVETANDGIWMLDAEGKTNFVNRRMAEMLGYQVHEMLGRTMFDFIDDEGFAAAAANFAGDAGRLGVRFRRKDGSPVWVLMSESELMDENLNYAGGLSMVTDVTAMKEAETEARSLAAIVEHATEPIISTDEEDIITSWNLAAEALLGYTAEEVLGRLVAVLLPPTVDVGHVRQVGDEVRSGKTLSFEEQELVAKGGERVMVTARLSPLRGDEGHIVGVSIFYHDIRQQLEDAAEKEQLQLRLQQSQRLETVGQLAGGIAHDFNNLLAVILNYADFLKADLPEGHAARDDVDEIHRAAERAAALTRQLLLFSRREVARPKVLDMNDVVRVAHNLLGRTIGEHIELRTVLADDLWNVRIDEGQLEQVLVNLVVNARDAMPQGGTLTVETENVTLDEASSGPWGAVAPGRYARICVTDTGVGMPREVIERAFEPFFTTKPMGQGTGLGLAMTYGIVEQARGHVLIYSEVGHGTAVKVYLPIVHTPSEQPAQPAASDGAPRGKGETVLLVEDEDAVRESTRRILSDGGYNVLTASDGLEALAICDETASIDLVLTDVVMPGMSGKQLAEQLPGRMRVLYMSGYTDQQILPDERGLLVEKPFGSALLLRKVRQVLNGVDARS